MIVGHETVVTELEHDLPPVTLLLGPESIGKAAIARHLAVYHNPATSSHAYYERLTAGVAREIVEQAPVRRAGLFIRVINLDSSTEAAQNILLKVLEEPPPHCRFILTASRVPLLTILSRSRTYRMGLLSSVQVAEVLMQNGVSKPEAGKAATRGRGQVAPALLSVDRESSRITSVVAAAVRAATEGTAVTVDMALRNWTPEHTRVLERWATEKANGRWVHFTPEFAPAATRRGALNILFVLTQYDARTAPAVALDVLREPK